ncbi:unnamed protein product, partial [Mesorhabditis spiculigera]
MAAGGQSVVYQALSADGPDAAPMEVESLCVNCEENGITRILLTSIPYYKSVILIAFECPHCGYKNNEVQSGEAVQEHGVEITLAVKEQCDLRRQIVKSEYASIEIPEIELTIPAQHGPAEVTTVESVLSRAIERLADSQPARRALSAEDADQVEGFLNKARAALELKTDWKLILHDPTGNCFIQNPDPMHVDPRAILVHYPRPVAEDKMLGLVDDNTKEYEEAEPVEPIKRGDENLKDEVMRIPTSCEVCKTEGELLMKHLDIPFFQEVIVMAFTCDNCGNKSNEIKSGGPIRAQGCKLSLTIAESIDLARDVLKSDTCCMSIPELDLEVGYGAISGRFTTVEGLLTATKEQLDQQFKFFTGDSAQDDEKVKMKALMESFDQILSLEKPVTLVLDDPAGNSYIQSTTAPLDDPRLHKDYYTRSREQDDDLGLLDMKVENYENDGRGMEAVIEEDEENEAN